MTKINHSCCLAAGGQLPFVRKAFKMACLSYQPNKVTHDDKVYSRQELLDKVKLMLQNIKDQLPDSDRLDTFQDFENITVK